MDKVRIFPILEYILNVADDEELQAIREALKRREQQRGVGGVDIHNVARETSRRIEGQVGGSVDAIRSMVRNFAIEMIHKEVPDISPEHLEQLIEAWVPDPGAGTSKKQASDIPKEALLTMIRQFIAYKTDSMRPAEYQALTNELGDWSELYWQKFPPAIRRILTKYLQNEIEADMCWELINRVL